MVTKIFDKQLKNNLELTGIPTAPTADPDTNTTQIATTAYADAKVADEINNDVTTIAPSQNAVFDALALKADITSLEIEKKLLMDEIDSLKKSAIENSNAPYLTVSDYGDVALAKNSVGVGTVDVDGVTVENLVNGKDVVNTGTVTFTSILNNVYWDSLHKAKLTGTGSDMIITNDTGAVADAMVINLTAHGLASLTEAQLAKLLPVYFNGEKTFEGIGCLVSKDSAESETGRMYFSTDPMYSNTTAKDTLTYSGGKYYHTHNGDSDGNAIAEPYDTEVETNGQFLALSEGTVTYEPWYPDIAVYTDKFTLTKAIIAVKELYKYGSETPITDAVIAGDGLSFTSASLTAGDLAYGVFEFDEPLRPLMTIKSRNDDATIADTANGKIYTFRPVITNGAIASWELTEV